MCRLFPVQVFALLERGYSFSQSACGDGWSGVTLNSVLQPIRILRDDLNLVDRWSIQRSRHAYICGSCMIVYVAGTIDTVMCCVCRPTDVFLHGTGLHRQQIFISCSQHISDFNKFVSVLQLSLFSLFRFSYY